MIRVKKKLMHTNNHPTNYVLKYISNEILKILGLPESNFSNVNNEILSQLPYSKYSLSHYKFEWLKKTDCDENIYINMIHKCLN